MYYAYLMTGSFYLDIFFDCRSVCTSSTSKQSTEHYLIVTFVNILMTMFCLGKNCFRNHKRRRKIVERTFLNDVLLGMMMMKKEDERMLQAAGSTRIKEEAFYHSFNVVLQCFYFPPPTFSLPPTVSERERGRREEKRMRIIAPSTTVHK